MIWGKKTAYAISAVIICVLVGALVYATVISPLPAQTVPKVALNSALERDPDSIEIEVAHVQLPEDPARQSLQWACFSLSLQRPNNASVTVNLGDLTWNGNETNWLSLFPGYELSIRSTPGNVTGMRVGDVICLRCSESMATGEWIFVLTYFPPGLESGRTSLVV